MPAPQANARPGANASGDTWARGRRPKRKQTPSDLRHQAHRLEKRIDKLAKEGAAARLRGGDRPDGPSLETLYRDLRSTRAKLFALTGDPGDRFIGHSASYISVPGAPLHKGAHSTSGAWPSKPSKAWRETHV